MVPSLDSGDDFVWIGGPDEGLGVMVGLGDEASNRRLELDEGAEDAALEAAPRELGEEALDGIEPGAGRLKGWLVPPRSGGSSDRVSVTLDAPSGTPSCSALSPGP